MQYNTFEVKGWKGIVRHHAPVQADTATGIAKFASWFMMHEWDLFCFAHYHHCGIMTLCGKKLFRNGSLVGGDDYAESLAKYDSPSQLCWCVTEENTAALINIINF